MLPLTLAAMLVLQAPAAQTAPPAAAITLDFLATDADGNFVGDLKPEEVALKVDGKRRPLLSLDLVTNAERGRSILLLVDEATLYGLEPLVKDGVKALAAGLGPGDRIAYVSTRRGRITALTPDHHTAPSALDDMVAGPGVLWTCMSDLIKSIESLTKTLPRGRSTTLVVLSRGSPYDPQFGGESGGSGCSPRTADLRQLDQVLSAAQITLHLLTVEHLNRSWGLDTLARNTHSLSGLLTWSNPTALVEAVASTSRYYRATFAADPKANDRPQRVELDVNRPKVKVRTSPTVRINPASAPGR